MGRLYIYSEGEQNLEIWAGAKERWHVRYDSKSVAPISKEDGRPLNGQSAYKPSYMFTTGLGEDYEVICLNEYKRRFGTKHLPFSPKGASNG